MPRQQLKPKDKVVLETTRDGAVEENLTKETQENVSRRQKDAELVKPAEIQPEETGEVKKPETARAGCGCNFVQSGRDRRRQAGCR